MKEKEQDKNFYIYSIEYFHNRRSLRDILLEQDKVDGCVVSPILLCKKDIYVIDKKFDQEFISMNFFRPIRVKFEGEILARWKKKSKNTNHTLILGFGRSLILRHYSEDIINKLRELKLIL